MYQPNDDSNDTTHTIYTKEKISHEIETITSSINHINITMQKYIDDTKILWDTQMKNFLVSNDCFILQYFSTNDYIKFLSFFITQEPFVSMIKVKKNLIERKEKLELHSSINEN